MQVARTEYMIFAEREARKDGERSGEKRREEREGKGQRA